jgi:DNA internalization-related competence protein ComEC/Rec2
LKKSDLTSLLADCHFEVYACVGFVLGFEYPIAWVLWAFYVFLLRRQIRIKLLLGLMILGFLGIQWIEKERFPNQIIGQGTVVDIKEMMYGHRVTVNVDHRRYHVYLYQEVKLGDVFFIKAKVDPYRKQTVPKGFDAQRYYQSQGIMGKLVIEEFTWLKKGFHIYDFRMKLLDQVSDFKSQKMILKLVFGESDLDERHEMTYRTLGVMHLFSMSGLHIYVLLVFLKKLMFHLNMRDRIQKVGIMLFLFSILYLYQGSHAILRIVLMTLIYEINMKYQLELTGLDRIQIVFISMIIMDIHLLIHQGFWIVYLIVNVIHLSEYVFRSMNFYTQKLTVTSIVQLTILPFTRLFSPMMIPIFPWVQMLVSFVIVPLSFATMIFPFLDQHLFHTIEIMDTLLHFLSKRNMSMSLPMLSPVWILFYFAFWVLLLRSKDWIGRTWKLILMMSIFLIPSLQSFQDQVTFLDVGQGDAIHIEAQGCSMMIDTFDGAYDYLVNHGIRHLDMLILTHSDTDHTYDAMSILSFIKVDLLVLSAYDDGYEKGDAHTIRVKSEDKLSCGQITLDILGPIRNYTNKNDNSIVIQTSLQGHTFLFTGDIEVDAERDLIRKYGEKLKSDVLKISHHGSNTSSTEAFIQKVDPKFAVISVGYQNRFGFPHEHVIQSLMKQDVSIYRTDTQGTIISTLGEKRLKWKIHLPYQS